MIEKKAKSSGQPSYYQVSSQFGFIEKPTFTPESS